MALRMRLILVLLLAMIPWVWAQGPGQQWVYLLDPDQGRVHAMFKLDGGPHRSRAQAGDRERYPFLDRVASAQVPDMLRPDARFPNFPTSYRGKVVESRPWKSLPDGGILTFLRYSQESEYDGPGVFAVLEARSGRVLWELPYSFRQAGAGRSTFWTPLLAAWKQFALVQDGQAVVALDLCLGKRLWQAPGRLSGSDLVGIWVFGDSLYANLEGGLTRLSLSDGSLRWRSPLVGSDIDNLTLRPDGSLCVVAHEPSGGVKKSLATRAETRYAGAGNFAINLVPHQVKLFALTGPPLWDDPKFDRPRRYAFWEYIGGKWNWVFDYPEKISEAERDRLYSQNRLSRSMRKRLEAFPQN